MLDIKLSDFKVGEKCYVEFTGNASRYKSKGYYEEWIVEKVSNKYVTANGFKFEEHDLSYEGLMEKVNGLMSPYLFLIVNLSILNLPQLFLQFVKITT